MSTRTWSGTLLDGVSAHRHPVEISVEAEGLRLTVAGGVLCWSYAHIRQTQGFYAGEPVRLEYGEAPAAAVIIEDHGILAAIHAQATAQVAQLDRPERRRRRAWGVGGVTFGLIAFLVVMYRWGIPWLAQQGAAFVPPAWEEKLGEMVSTAMTDDRTVCDDPTLNLAIGQMTAQIAAVLSERDYTFTVRVVDQPTLNAFAAPGGHIVIFTGLLQKTATPDELAGVLAHEMQHVVQRHGTKSLLRELASQAVLAMVFGDAGGFTQAIAEGARTFGSLRYQRADETEADRTGMEAAAAAGFNPGGMLQFFATMRAEQMGLHAVIPEYLSSHPSPDSRLHELSALAERIEWRPHLVKQVAPWEDLRMRCGKNPP